MSEPLCVTGANLNGEMVGLRADDGLITAVGPAVEPEPGDRIIDAAGDFLCPPLVNAHTHAAMTLFRGHGDDLPLMRWLTEAIWPVEENLEDEDVYWGTRLACLEMIRTGTTAFWDMYWKPVAVARAVTDAGLRAVVGPPLIDPQKESALAGRNQGLVDDLDELAGFGPRITAAVAPHSIYTGSPESLELAAGLAGERGLPVEIHLSETEGEVRDCLDKYGIRPAELLDRVGLLTESSMLAHGVWLDDGEFDLISERGSTVSTNPVANMKLAVGRVFPYPAARRAGVGLALGTDGAGSNNSLDLFSDLKTFALAQRHAAVDAEAIPVHEAWSIASGARSPLIAASGTIAEGQAADFLLLDASSPELALGDFESNLVYTAAGSVVRTTVVAGEVLMEDRHVEGAAEVMARARERAVGLGLAEPA